MQKPLPTKLPDEWIERIFMRFHGRFGNKFLDQYRIGELNDDNEDIGILNAKLVWSERLAHLSKERLMRGLDADYKFTPDCDAFKIACVPVPDCHRDNKNILALPKPKMTDAEYEEKRKRMFATLNIKKVPA